METTVFLQRYKPFASSKDKNITYLVHPLKPQTSISFLTPNLPLTCSSEVRTTVATTTAWAPSEARGATFNW
ncbi:hypothetical protein Bca101_038051 [Brassica carinata]